MAWSRRFIPKLFVSSRDIVCKGYRSSDIVRMKWRYYRAGLYTEKKSSHWLKQWPIRKGLGDKKGELSLVEDVRYFTPSSSSVPPNVFSRIFFSVYHENVGKIKITTPTSFKCYNVRYQEVKTSYMSKNNKKTMLPTLKVKGHNVINIVFLVGIVSSSEQKQIKCSQVC